MDRTNPSCSDAGPGTPAVPYCTIGAARADTPGVCFLADDATITRI